MAQSIKGAMDKEMKKALNRLINLGCTWQLDGQNHIRITTPEGDQYRWPSTPPNPGITIKKARTIERRLRAGSRRPTAGPSLNPSAD